MGARRPLSEETKRRISEAQKARPRRPHSAETRQKMSEAHKGKPKSAEHRANLWKNRVRTVPTYGSIHQAMRASRGSARTHDCVDCDKPAYDWSLRSGTKGLIYDSSWPGWFSTNPDDYEPRCRGCHISYDRK